MHASRPATLVLGLWLLLADPSLAATIGISTRPLAGEGAGMPAVAIDSGGVATVVWYETAEGGGTAGVFARRFDVAGAALGPVFQVNTTPVTADFSLGAYFGLRAGVAVGAGGRALVVWPDGDPTAPRLFGRLYEANGVATSPTDHVIAVDGGDEPSVAGDPTGFLVAWGRNYADEFVNTYDDVVMARRLDASGQPVGASIELYDQGTVYVPILTAVTYTGVGYTIAWKAQGGLRARRLDVAGTPLGDEIDVGSLHQPAIASDGTGAFTIVARDAVASTLVASRFDADGDPVGTPAIVNSLQTPNHNGWGAAMGTSGEAVALWIVQDEVAGRHRVVGRRLDASNTPVGEEFVLAERELLTLYVPAPAWIEPLGFFAAWTYRTTTRASIEGFAWHAPAPVFARSLKLKDHVDPSKRKLTFKSSDVQISTLANLAFEPDQHGLYVHVFNTQGTGDSACLALPAAGWTASGTAFRRVLKYKDATFANGPCKKAIVREGRLTVTCIATTQPISYSLDEPSQGTIGVEVTSGASRVCADLGGRITRDEPLAFSAVSAPRATTCPTPPVSCP